MVEAADRIPSSSDYDSQAISLGAFRKAIKLTKNDINTNKTYYLLLAGE
jgi:hypothetical protein